MDSDTFIGDGRFQVLHPPNSDTWTLLLRGGRGSDSGQYECQISSEPKLSLVYQLNVVGIYEHRFEYVWVWVCVSIAPVERGKREREERVTAESHRMS